MFPNLEEIAKKRKLLGLTQKQLAMNAHVSQSLVAKLESGKIDPSYTKVKRIFDVLEQLGMKTEANAGQVLKSRVVGVMHDDAVLRAITLMTQHGYSQLPVFDRHQVVGSISEKTILGQISLGKNLEVVSNLPVEEIMDEAFPQVGKSAPLPAISSLLHIYPAVLVADKSQIVGIITKADLLKIV